MIRWHSSVPDVSSEGELWPGTGEPTFYEATSILFTDFVGFTDMVANISPQALVDELNEIFAAFDIITHQQGLDKVKTIGDAYMAVAGLDNQDNHAVAAVRVAKEMLAFLEKRNQEKDLQWNRRVGIHSGPVVGGVIGSQKLAFDLWGDTVNVASRIESMGAASKINISVLTRALIKEVFDCEYRGEIAAKGTGEIEMYWVK